MYPGLGEKTTPMEKRVCICMLVLYHGQLTSLHTNSARLGTSLLGHAMHPPALVLSSGVFLI